MTKQDLERTLDKITLQQSATLDFYDVQTVLAALRTVSELEDKIEDLEYERNKILEENADLDKQLACARDELQLVEGDVKHWRGECDLLHEELGKFQQWARKNGWDGISPIE